MRWDPQTNNFTQPMIRGFCGFENNPRVKRCPKASSCCNIPITLIDRVGGFGSWFLGYWLAAVMAVDKAPVGTPVVPALVKVPSLLTV
jgi:hypothetical protein